MVDLRGARSKIERAKHHISDLEAAISSFLALSPYALTPEYYAEQNVTAYFLDTFSPVPDEISLLIGDAAHNLRTALDFLAYALARNANPTTTLNHIYFPISKSFSHYKAELPGKTKGIAQESVDAITAIQPYGGGNDDLWGLHLLDIIDKHKLLVTAAIVTDKMWFTVDTESVNNAFRHVFSLPPISIPQQAINFPAPPQIQSPKKGALLHSIGGNHEADKDIHFTFGLTLEEPDIFKGKPIVPTLRQLASLVDSIVGSFV